tara:strand:+ start:312 stop:500 length:189 start_codon:yes stop_codon:yes gene_type:complete
MTQPPPTATLRLQISLEQSTKQLSVTILLLTASVLIVQKYEISIRREIAEDPTHPYIARAAR